MSLARRASALDQVAEPGGCGGKGCVREVAGLEGVFESNVGFGVHAERRAVGQAHDRMEAQARLAHGQRGLGLVHDEAQMRGARMGHCRVPAEVLIILCDDRAP